ncbi:response regulator [Methanoregula sp.]|uniref:response regulator n=1 Tax=Methanoregula sp. TaxID=2052170 RepID=UPI0023749C57|nr:response regulator [Methanoregula sp.]MDD1687084.1 response regulator [Methanoregula sp.]
MISVLYVDDESILLEIAKIYLERTGQFQVDTLVSAPAALERMKTRRYDVIISDYQMPEMDGIEFLKKIRATWPTLPVIIFTGRGREEVVIEALNAGADHYLQKGGGPKSQFAELVHMITRSVERRQASETILHLNRLYAVVSRINRAVIHIRDRQELLVEACRIAIDEGKFLMAWIGMIDGETHNVIPVAACGYEEGYLSNISVSTDNIPAGMGLTGTAIREGRPMISNDIASDPRMENYRHEAARRGYRSSAALPLICRGKAIGAIRFYAAEVNFFNDREIRLLEELVEDLCFALDLIDNKENSAG